MVCNIVSRRRISRKKYAERAKRMAGQGLDAYGRERDWRDPYGPLPRDGNDKSEHGYKYLLIY